MVAEESENSSRFSLLTATPTLPPALALPLPLSLVEFMNVRRVFNCEMS